MTTSAKASKQPLVIRLAESVVFLRGSSDAGLSRNQAGLSDSPPAMLRGLLTMNLTKPTRISSIEITLEGKSVVQWPEGPVHRRVDVTEEKTFLTARTVFFDAKSLPSNTRSLSVGPGSRRYDGYFDHDNEDTRPSLINRHDSSSSSLSSIDGLPPMRTQRRNSIDGYRREHEPPRYDTLLSLSSENGPTPPPSPLYTPVHTPREFPASPRSGSPVDMRADSSSRLPGHEDHPGQILEEYRNLLRVERSRSLASRSSSLSVHFSHDLTSPEFIESGAIYSGSAVSSQIHLSPLSPPLDSPPLSRSASRDTDVGVPTSSGASLQGPSFHSPRRSSPSSSTPRFLRPQTPSNLTPESEADSRGRRHSSRWSLSNMTHVLRDARYKFRSLSREPEPPRGRDPEPRLNGETRAEEYVLEQDEERSQYEGRKSALGKLTATVRYDEHSHSETWKEFRKGVYTYPISFTIPLKCPPTMHCDFGGVAYRLKAVVHRPGALTAKLSATCEVILVAGPPEDDAEETHSIIVERQWDTQLRYLIALGGRSFVIGSHVPFSLTFVPLEKCKIYRLSVFLEEKVQYRVRNGGVTREQPVKRFELLSIRHQERNSPPILPLSPEHAALFTPYIDTSGLVSSTPDEALSSLMGPGPWVLSHDLQLPTDCGRVHFTYKHKSANIIVHHTLKIVFRVERGDNQAVDPKSGKRRLFDIVIQTPIQLLSCHCNPEWTALPRYSLFDPPDPDAPSVSHHCGCTHGAPMSHFPFHYHSNSPAVTPGHHTPTTTERQPGLTTTNDSPLTSEVINSSHQFARLIAGEEGVLGDAPPRYEATMH